MKKSFLLTDKEVTQKIQEWLESADGDELGYIVGEIFGGMCHAQVSNETEELEYNFIPDENYFGAFDE